MRIAGVSLEDSFLRISITDKKIGIIKPVKSEDIKLPVSEQERSLAIRETFRKLKEEYKAGNVVIGLNLSNFSHNFIDLPSLSKADMRNAILFELEKYLPLPPEEYIYDFSVIEKMQNKMRTLVLSIRKDRVNELLTVVRDSGLGLAGIRCSFIEALNEFIASDNIKDAVFIYAAEASYYLAALKGQRPVLFKTVPKGKSAAAELEGLAASAGGDIYISGHPDPEVLNKLNAKTLALSPANAIALSALKKSKVEMNFMPAGLLPEKKDYYPYAIAAMTALAVVIFFFTEIYSYYKDYAALHAVEKKIEQIKSAASGPLETRKKMETIYEKRKLLHEFQGKRNLNIKALTELSRFLPKDTWLVSMSVDEKGKVDIEGFAKRASGIIEPLSKSKFFKKVEFVSPIISQDGQERFSIRMEIAG
ncbi:MAG: hypothetical protein EPN94_03075 [Nitrospirae bacterium]|nr:MAG: hypothetical protein EPN94_03075 [Nitrospirota bacterium]